MSDLTDEQKLALDHARHLAENGVPLFLAEQDGCPLGFQLPKRWQHSEADPSVVDHWTPGMALCAVMGHVVDAVDIDPRNGGDVSALNGTMPRSYGQQATPSGGTHFLIATLGVRNGKAGPGIDVQAGDAEGNGRGFIFLAPTERVSKTTGQPSTYEWVQAPDVETLALVGEADNTGAKLADMLRSRGPEADYSGPSYDGPSYDELDAEQRDHADAHVASVVRGWAARLEEAAGWDEGERDAPGRGWEALTRDCAWHLARLAVAPWSSWSVDDAEAAFHDVVPDVIARDEKCKGKWTRATVAKAGKQPVKPPPWEGRSTPADDFDAVPVGADIVRLLERFRPVDLAELLDPNRPPREYVVEPMIATGTAVALVAPAGHRKSLVALALALAVARGDEDFAGMKIPRARRVCYLDMENTEDDLRERMESFGVTRDEDLSRFRLLHLPSMEALDTRKGGEDFIQLVDALGLEPGDLVVLDSYQRITESGENDSDTTRGYYRHTGVHLKARGLTVIRTDNTGKDASRGARGSSGKRDDVDVEYLLKSEDDYIEITTGKVRQRGITSLTLAVYTDDQGRTTFHSEHESPAMARTRECVELLDHLTVPDDAGDRKAGAALKDDGQNVPRAVIRSAVKMRQKRAESARRAFSNEPLEELAKTAPNGNGAARRGGEELL